MESSSVSINNMVFAIDTIWARRLDILGTNLGLGPLVRIAPNLLSVSDPLQLPSIYTRNVDKTPFYSTGMAGSVAPLLLMQEHNIHSQMVKVFAPTVGS